MSAQSLLDGYLDAEERDSRKLGTRNLSGLIRLILRHPAPLLSGMALVLLSTAATLTEPRLFGYAIDDAILPGNWERLKVLGGAFFVLICVRVVTVIFQSYLFELLGQRVTLDLRLRLFSHLQRLPMQQFDKNPSGRLMTRVTNDIASLNEMFTAGFVAIAGNILLVAGILGWLIALDLRLGLISASVFPFLLIVSYYFSGRLRISYREARSKLSALNAFLAENFIGMKVVHLFSRQKTNLERFDRINRWYADAQIGTVRIFALFQPTITVSSGLSIALVVAFGGKAALLGSIKPGVLVAYFSYVLSLFQPVREIADKWNIFLSAMASAERVFSILEWPTEIPESDARVPARRIEDLRGHIVFENVWFAYNDEHWVLKDFNLEIQPGMKVGVVGHTGAGKTTLISLLMRFYDPQKGRILLDGKDLRDCDRRSLRASIGIIQQDVFLFSGTYRDNMTFWDDPAESDSRPKSREVRSVLESMKHENWWNGSRAAQGAPEIQERGSNLSVGEKQVIAFSRALYSDPRIWILDEATANMDSETEALLEKALTRAGQRHTMIMIAHRLATVRNADKILVLHKGSLVEEGRHEELVRKDGLYARLFRYQLAQAKGNRALTPRGVSP